MSHHRYNGSYRSTSLCCLTLPPHGSTEFRYESFTCSWALAMSTTSGKSKYITNDRVFKPLFLKVGCSNEVKSVTRVPSLEREKKSNQQELFPWIWFSFQEESTMKKFKYFPCGPNIHTKWQDLHSILH